MVLPEVKTSKCHGYVMKGKANQVELRSVLE
jgi:hypothetical protein